MHYPVVPARPVREMITVERGSTEVRGILAAAIMRRVEGGEAAIAERQSAAHETSPAVAAGEIFRAPTLVAAIGFRLDRDAVGVLAEAGHLPAKANGDVGSRARVLQLERLDVHLIGAEQRLGDLVGGGRGGDGATLLGLRRHRDAAKLPAG